MAWGTLYTQEVDLIRHSYTYKHEVEEAIDNLKHSIERNKATLLALASCTPKDIIKPDDDIDDALDVIQIKFNNTWEVLQEDVLTLYKLEGLLENWETKQSY